MADRKRSTRMARRGAAITKITRVDYSRSGLSAYVAWEDERGEHGTTHGSTDGAHMRALLERAAREHAEGVPPSCGSCNADLGPSTAYPWHYANQDCRAIRRPSVAA